MLTAMTVLLEKDTENTQSPLLDVPRFTIVVMSLFHLLKEIFQIWDEVSNALNVFLIKVQNARRNDFPICKNTLYAWVYSGRKQLDGPIRKTCS